MAMQKLFSYGTLQYESVQLETFGRRLEGHADILTGYRLDTLEIKDPKVIALSGETVHKVLRYTGNVEDQVPGKVFTLTQEEIDLSDEYEVDDYKRVLATLQSGMDAWVYVAAC